MISTNNLPNCPTSTGELRDLLRGWLGADADADETDTDTDEPETSKGFTVTGSYR